MTQQLDQTSGRSATSLPTATLGDSLALLADVLGPTAAKGPIIRRPLILRLAESVDADRRAVRRMQKLRSKYGQGPVILPIPMRPQAIVLDPDDALRVLDESPDPFSTASLEKRGALSHFEPFGALISGGEARQKRRRFNEDALQQTVPVHGLAGQFLSVVDEEMNRLMSRARQRGQLGFQEFYETWFHIVLRVVFGDSARNDWEIVELMEHLRGRGNFTYFYPKSPHKRDRLLTKIRQHIERAEAGSLCEVMKSLPQDEETKPESQVPQWLFAFDPAAMTTFRALALLVTHRAQLDRAMFEVEGGQPSAMPYRHLLRAAILESLRLWPTTPLVLRETTRSTHWETGILPADTSVILFAPYFHRDDERLAYAHRFTPDLWTKNSDEIDGSPPVRWPFIPFSDGPAVCPGRNLVLLLTTAALTALLDEGRTRLKDPSRLDAEKPLPGTLNHFTLRFLVAK